MGPGGRVLKQDVEGWAARREGLVVVAEGLALEVSVAGEGDPVLLLPGLGTDVAAFARQTPMLVESHRVQGVNPRGVGLSDAPDTPSYDVADLAADAASLIATPTHVIGASLGAAVAIELALSRPERVRSLTLITPFLEAGPRLLAVAEGWCRIAAAAGADAVAGMLLPWLFSGGYLADERRTSPHPARPGRDRRPRSGDDARAQHSRPALLVRIARWRRARPEGAYAGAGRGR